MPPTLPMRRSTLRPRSTRLRALDSRIHPMLSIATLCHPQHRSANRGTCPPCLPRLGFIAHSSSSAHACRHLCNTGSHPRISILVFFSRHDGTRCSTVVSRLDTRSPTGAMPANQHNFDARRATAADHLFADNSQSGPPSVDILPAASSSLPPHPFDDVDDRLRHNTIRPLPCIGSIRASFDDESALFGERDVSTTLSPHEYNAGTSAATQSAPSLLAAFQLSLQYRLVLEQARAQRMVPAKGHHHHLHLFGHLHRPLHRRSRLPPRTQVRRRARRLDDEEALRTHRGA